MARSERGYNPVCETCHSRPKMDRSDCCEECWYSGRFNEERMLRALTPEQQAAYLRARIAADRGPIVF
jgi:hypothetical protein